MMVSLGLHDHPSYLSIGQRALHNAAGLAESI